MTPAEVLKQLKELMNIYLVNQKVAFIGDSIVNGFDNLNENYLCYSFPGAEIKHISESIIFLEQNVLEFDPKVICISVGTNNISTTDKYANVKSNFDSVAKMIFDTIDLLNLVYQKFKRPIFYIPPIPRARVDFEYNSRHYLNTEYDRIILFTNSIKEQILKGRMPFVFFCNFLHFFVFFLIVW